MKHVLLAWACAPAWLLAQTADDDPRIQNAAVAWGKVTCGLLLLERRDQRWIAVKPLAIAIG